MRGAPPTWRQLHPDDNATVEAIRFSWLRTATAAEKLGKMGALNRQARRLAMAGLRLRNPGATPPELQRLLAELLLGPTLAEKAFGPLPADAGRAPASR